VILFTPAWFSELVVCCQARGRGALFAWKKDTSEEQFYRGSLE